MSERLKGGPVVLLVFGALLAISAGLQFIFAPRGATPKLLLGGAAAASVLVGLAIVAWRSRPAPTMKIIDLSMATTTLGFGIAGMVVGAEFGLWLILIGGGMAVIGVGGLAREWRALRR